MLLDDWDGRLTSLTRKRVSRHIDQCDVCTDRKHGALRPAALYGMAPLAALPPGLREEVLGLCADARPVGAVVPAGRDAAGRPVPAQRLPAGDQARPGSGWLALSGVAAAVGILIAIVATGIVTVLALDGSHTPPQADAARSGDPPGSAVASVTASPGSAGAALPEPAADHQRAGRHQRGACAPPRRIAFGLADQGEAVTVGHVFGAALPHADTATCPTPHPHADIDADGHPHADADADADVSRRYSPRRAPWAALSHYPVISFRYLVMSFGLSFRPDQLRLAACRTVTWSRPSSQVTRMGSPRRMTGTPHPWPPTATRCCRDPKPPRWCLTPSSSRSRGLTACVILTGSSAWLHAVARNECLRRLGPQGSGRPGILVGGATAAAWAAGPPDPDDTAGGHASGRTPRSGPDGLRRQLADRARAPGQRGASRGRVRAVGVPQGRRRGWAAMVAGGPAASSPGGGHGRDGRGGRGGGRRRDHHDHDGRLHRIAPRPPPSGSAEERPA